MQPIVPPLGRALAGLPLEMEDPDGEDRPRPGVSRRDGQGGDSSRNGSFGRDLPGKPWWRPASRVGRIFLALTVLAMLGGLAASAYLLKTRLSRDARFRISGAGNIQADGLTEVSRAQILPVFGEDIGRNIFFVPLSERRRQLEQIPWIEKATVMRVFPNQIRVSVVERQPVAFTRQGQKIGLVDANGILLSMPAAIMARRHYSFPVVTGIDAVDPLPSRKARMAVYQRLLADLDASGEKLSAQLSEVDLTDPEDARVTLQDDSTLLHLGQDQFLARYQRYKAHIAEWRQQYPRLASVDLRYDQQVVLEMASGDTAAQVSAGDPGAAIADQQKQPDLKAAANAQAAGDSAEKHKQGTKLLARPASVHPSQLLQRQIHAAGAGRSAAAKRKPGKAGAKPATRAAARSKTAAAKEKAVRDKAVKAKAQQKKRAEDRSAALNRNRRRTAPINRPALSAGMGQ